MNMLLKSRRFQNITYTKKIRNYLSIHSSSYKYYVQVFTEKSLIIFDDSFFERQCQLTLISRLSAGLIHHT
jgi:hypothetical protein